MFRTQYGDALTGHMMEEMMIPASVDFVVVEAVAPGAPTTTIAHIAFRLRIQRPRIIANWALRVATLPAFRAMPDLALDEVERNIPDVLESVLITISTSDPTMDPGPLQRATALADAHGRNRYLDDFSAGDVLSEFNALYHEVWSAFWRVIDEDHASLELSREFSRRLGATFDVISVAAVDAWVAAAR